MKMIWNTEDDGEFNHVHGNVKWNECDAQISLTASPNSEDRLEGLTMKPVQISLMLNVISNRRDNE